MEWNNATPRTPPFSAGPTPLDMLEQRIMAQQANSESLSLGARFTFSPSATQDQDDDTNGMDTMGYDEWDKAIRSVEDDSARIRQELEQELKTVSHQNQELKGRLMATTHAMQRMQCSWVQEIIHKTVILHNETGETASKRERQLRDQVAFLKRENADIRGENSHLKEEVRYLRAITAQIQQVIDNKET